MFIDLNSSKIPCNSFFLKTIIEHSMSFLGFVGLKGFIIMSDGGFFTLWDLIQKFMKTIINHITTFCGYIGLKRDHKFE
jgi:hypothetical protein